LGNGNYFEKVIKSQGQAKPLNFPLQAWLTLFKKKFGGNKIILGDSSAIMHNRPPGFFSCQKAPSSTRDGKGQTNVNRKSNFDGNANKWKTACGQNSLFCSTFDTSLLQQSLISIVNQHFHLYYNN